MKREIKFRAWGKNSKEFLQDAKGYGFTLKEIQNIHDLDIWELTQYTGLLDKKGKEIYEGDIIKKWEKIHQFTYGKPVTSKADTVSKIFVFNDIRQAGQYEGTDMRYYEVIGNVFENKDLL